MTFTSTGSAALDDLVATVSVTEVGPDRFRGRGSIDDGVDATFGGHFVAQAVSAALATIEPGRVLHSAHAHFVRAGRPGVPFLLAVERIRDGRSFSLRRVRAFQPDEGDEPDGRVLFELTASCTRPEEGPEHQAVTPPDLAGLPQPESLASYPELMAGLDPKPLPEAWAGRRYGIDVRTVNAPWVPAGPSPEGGIRLWIRADGTVPDDPHLHAALFAYQTDESLADNVAVPWGATWGAAGVVFVSLDHALWLHHPLDLNEWHLLDQRPVVVGRGRGLATASLWDRRGRLVATVTQEALFRLDDDFEPFEISRP